MSEKQPVIEVKGIKKGFFGVPVLKGIDMKLYEGECVSLIGENGAGKSTLIKILCGVYTKDEGEILLNGVVRNITNAEEAKELGISVIYQELSLFPDMTVYENIFMNNELVSGGNKKSSVAKLNIKQMKEEAARVLHDRLHVDVDVNALVKDIPFSQRQMVEIGRAVYADSQFIFMDEPTTALEDKEKQTLFQIIRDLKAQKKTIIFISHHLDEIFANCDRTIVLRDGLVVLEKDTQQLTEKELVAAMIGRSVENYYPKVHYEIGKEMLKVEGLTSKVFSDITFDLKENEILGIIGLAGCGKYEIIRALFGAHPYSQGTITMNGKVIGNRTTKEAIANKFAFLPSERKTESIFPEHDINWNTTIANLDAINETKGLNLRKENDITAQYIKDLSVKVTKQTQSIASLSGGNQQKVILARWFLANPDILLLEEPTRGIDVNAKTEVYNLIMDYVGQKGHGVIVVSSEEEEILGICDRILVIRNGRINGILDRKDTDLERLKTITKFGEERA